ncbi:molybdopterin-guanine dinucleotide biosynthesis protein A [Bacillus ectoiniformans]|uniref:molybdenum cofactor guanylyltransferase n=1 Tax=Bacillus ectoiniformans TaxID=1494429 RepID=UPI00195C8E82|nr:molybdenum cofactor guanylyltransferase [Bacillus ectoiniformans]MBM7649058.1 molybdopterin-guanine dinucleotide biosynthesis protein A [Bacillus ectoiniformans]
MCVNDRQGVTGIILAGGESRRFGRPKAFAKYDGKYFYEHALHALRPYTQEVVLVSHPTIVNQFPKESDYQVIEDLDSYKGKGPLAGIYSVMKQFPAEWYFVLACDMPLMNWETVGEIISLGDKDIQAVVPSIDDKIQPLSALYHQSVLTDLEQQLEQGNYRMMGLLERVIVKIVTEETLPFSGQPFKNINNQTSYQQLVVRDN